MFDEAPAHLSGATFLANIRAFEARVGVDTLERALGRLPEERRAEYEAVVPVAWVRASTADLLYEAIADEAGEELFAVYANVVEEATREVLRTHWRSLPAPMHDDAIAQRIVQFHARSTDRGELSVRVVGPGHAEIELVGWPDASELRLLAIASAATAIISHAGREQVGSSRRRTDDGAVFDLRWRG